MRKLASAVLVLLAACEVTSGERARSEKFELPSTPIILTGPMHVGPGGYRLGTSVAPCRAQGFVAGAPGVNKLLVFNDDAGVYRGPFGANILGSGLAVACEERGVGRRFVFSGGTDGLFVSDPDGGQQLLFQGEITAMSRAPLGVDLVVGGDSEAQLLNSVSGNFMGGAGGGLTFGAAVRASRASAGYVVISEPAIGKVHLYDAHPGGGGGLTFIRSITSPTNAPGFGTALAIGDVHPNAGEELIISSPQTDQVFVYPDPSLPNQRLPLLTVGSPSVGSDSFGTALEVEPNAAGTLGAIWIGSASLSEVTRYIGTAAQARWMASGTQLGTSLAIDRSKTIVGAPEFSNGSGAVFEIPHPPSVNGTPMVCDDGQPCSAGNCTTGLCVGDVFCSTSVSTICIDCNANGECIADDGGIPVGGGGGAMGTIMVGGGTATGGGMGSTGGGGMPTGGGDGSSGGGMATGGGDATDGGSGGGMATGGGDSASGGGLATGGGVEVTDGGGELQPTELIRYTSCGCSSGTALPTLLLGVFLARRWRRR